MSLYQLHDFQNALLAPWNFAAEATKVALHNPFVPVSYTQVSRSLSASAELFERSTRQFGKPFFNLQETKRRGLPLRVEEETVWQKPFCNLLHFKRASLSEKATKEIAHDPKVLLIAPLAGHHATLLRGTVEALLPEHDVYITDWLDARRVPTTMGKFDLDDDIDYVRDMIRFLGPRTHVIAVCQATVPALCATALMAENGEMDQPATLTLMGGPIDTSIAPTRVNAFAKDHSLEWFDANLVHEVPFYYPGKGRRVYPGFLQIQNFIAMHPDKHLEQHFKMFQNLVIGDEESAEKTKKFYDEYLAVMDIPGEFYEQTLQRVFMNHDLPKGSFLHNGQLVRPEAIRQTAILTVEGELDDISAPGQTLAALKLCSGVPDSMKASHLEIGVGHYGIFNGRKWRNNIQPKIAEFIRLYDAEGAAPTPHPLNEGGKKRTLSPF